MKRHYMELWLLLATAFAVFALLSVSDLPLKKVSFARVYKPQAAVIQPEYETEILETTPEPCDTTAQTILLFGDSMLEGLGPRLAAYAKQNGHELYSVIWYSSTSEIWGNSDKLSRYIEQLAPTYIFICLGANELFVRNIAERRKHIDSILAQIGDIPYLWIGPPNWADDTGINDLIAGTTRPGSYFKSKGMAFERSADGAHPTLASASQWVDSVVRWMPANARHRIRLDVPEMHSSRPTRTFVHKPSERI